MITAEAQRTLVKSPPELWSALSDPSSLEAHLDQFGAIRIIRVDHERSVEWEATAAHGTVEIKPSGWGTTVTLSMTIGGAQPTPVVQAAGSGVPDALGDVQKDSTDTQHVLPPTAEASARSAGVMARIRRRWAQRKEFGQPPVAPDTQAEEVEVEVQTGVTARARVSGHMRVPTSVAIAAGATEAEPSAAAEPVDAERAEALLTAVLDRLGEARHRPFSRS